MNYKKEIVDIALAILDKRIGIIEGARELSQFQFVDNLQDDKNILFFVGVDSETDHLPVGKERENWDRDALKGKEKEIQEFEDFYRKNSIKACTNLIELLSK